jgi:hypothetical protein
MVVVTGGQPTLEAERRPCPQSRPPSEEQWAPQALVRLSSVSHAYLPPSALLYTARVACRATGRVDPTPHVASGRRLEGGRPCWGGQDPGGLGQPLTGDPSAMAGRPLAALAQGPIARSRKGRARTKVWLRTEIAVNAGAERAAPWGGQRPPSGLRSRCPRTRRTLRGLPRDGLRMRLLHPSNPSSQRRDLS